MIDLKLIYELYTKEINDRLTRALNTLVAYKESHAHLKTLLLQYKDVIEKYSNLTIEVLFDSTSIGVLNQLRFPDYVVFKEGNKIPFKAIRMYIEKYIECNKIIETTNIEVNKCKQELITFKLYKLIISKCNDKIIEKVITENYKAEPLKSFGAISVIRVHNEHRRPNWGVSNKLRKAILEKGGIPYTKEGEEEATKNGIEYKGEEWLVFHPPLDFFIQWHTKWISKELNPYLRDYKYTPARGNNSIVKRLQAVKDDRERALLLYTRTLNK